MTLDDLWTPTSDPSWDVDRVLAAVGPFLRDGVTYRACSAARLYESMHSSLDSQDWHAMRKLIEDRVAQGAREHNFDLWKNRPPLQRLVEEMREEAADEIVYGAMLAMQLGTRRLKRDGGR